MAAGPAMAPALVEEAELMHRGPHPNTENA
jgi:hypothetical protein